MNSLYRTSAILKCPAQYLKKGGVHIRHCYSNNKKSQVTIDVAKAAGFTFLRVVKTARPVNCNVTFISAEPSGAL